MRILIEHGANVNCCLPHPQNPEGCTLLMIAAKYDDVTAARMLIDAGAKVDGEPVESKSGVGRDAPCRRSRRESDET
jgi:ankyrin repeat protein